MRSLILALLLPALPLAAEEYRPVVDRDEFLNQLSERALTNRVFGITLFVTPDGLINGNAVRWPVTGSWSWVDGAFCREMDWSGMAIEYNCQLVELRGDQMRFTVDRGQGDSATFRLR